MADAHDIDGSPVVVGYGEESLLIFSRIATLGMSWAVHLAPDQAIKLAERILQGCDERGWL